MMSVVFDVVEWPSRRTVGSAEIYPKQQTVRELRDAIKAAVGQQRKFSLLSAGAAAAPIPARFEAKLSAANCIEPPATVGARPSVRVRFRSAVEEPSSHHQTTLSLPDEEALGDAQEGRYGSLIARLPSLGSDAIAARDDLGSTLLHYVVTSIGYLRSKAAAGEGGTALDAVRAIVAVAPHAIHALDSRGQTALHCAAENGERAIAELLLDKGADVNAADAAMRSPLHLAASGRHAEVCRLLLKRGANPRARADDSSVAQDLCELCGVIVEPPSAPELRMSSLHVAAADHDHSALAELLDQADEDQFVAQADGGVTPLHLFLGRRKAPEDLIAFVETALRLCGRDGAAWSVQDDLGRTPLHVAFENYALTEQALQEIVPAAKRSCAPGGATISEALDARGMSLLHHSARRGFVLLAEMLLTSCGLSPEGRASSQTRVPEPRTPTPRKQHVSRLGVAWSPRPTAASTATAVVPSPLALAIVSRCKETALLLARSGAQPTSTGENGEPVLWLAAKLLSIETDDWGTYTALARAMPSANPNPAWRGVDVLHLVCAAGSLQGVAALAELGVQISTATPQEDERAMLGEISRFLVGKKGKKTMRAKLSDFPPPSLETSSPLVLAAAGGHTALVRELFRCGVEENVGLPFAVAVFNGQTETAWAIIKASNQRSVPHGADLGTSPAQSPFVVAALAGKRELVLDLLRLGWEVSAYEASVAVHWCLDRFSLVASGSPVDPSCETAKRICLIALDRIATAQSPELSLPLVDCFELAVKKKQWAVASRLLGVFKRGSEDTDSALLKCGGSRFIRPINRTPNEEALGFVRAVVARFGTTSESVALASLAWDIRGFEACIRSDISSEEPLPFFHSFYSEMTSIGTMLSPRKSAQVLGRSFYSAEKDAANSGLFAPLSKDALGVIVRHLGAPDAENLRRTCKHLRFWNLSDEQALGDAVNAFISARSRGVPAFKFSLQTGQAQLIDLLCWRSQGKTFLDHRWDFDATYPLLLAAFCIQAVSVEVLLTRGALPDGPENAAVTPLCATLFTLALLEAENGWRHPTTECVALEMIAMRLIDAGCDVNRAVVLGDVAASSGTRRNVWSTLQGLQDSLVATPLVLACYAKNRSIVEKLVGHGALYMPPSIAQVARISPLQALLSPVGVAVRDSAAESSSACLLAIDQLLCSCEGYSPNPSEKHPIYKVGTLKLAVLAEAWGIAQRLVVSGASPLEYSAGSSPLDVAAAFGPLELVEKMLQSALASEIDEAALLFAKISSLEDALSSEVRKSSRVRRFDPIPFGARRCLKPDVLQSTLSGAKDSARPSSSSELSEIMHLSPMAYAAIEGRGDAVDLFLLHKGSWLSPIPAVSHCLLHTLAWLGNECVLRKLLDAGLGRVALDDPGSCEAAPVVYAAAGGNADALSALIEKGALASPAALGAALANDHSEAALRVLRAMPFGSDLSGELPPSISVAKYTPGKCALLLASEQHGTTPEMLEELLQRTNSPSSIRGPAGETPLDCAIAVGNSAVADVLSRNHIGRSIVGDATPAKASDSFLLFGLLKNGGDPGVVQNLLETRRADPFEALFEEASPLMAAVRNHHEDLVELCLKHWNLDPDAHEVPLLSLLAIAGRVGARRAALAIALALDSIARRASQVKLLQTVCSAARCGHEDFCTEFLPRCEEAQDDSLWEDLASTALCNGMLALCQALASVRPIVWSEAVARFRRFLPEKVDRVLVLAGVLPQYTAPSLSSSSSAEAVSRVPNVSYVALLELQQSRWAHLRLPPDVGGPETFKRHIDTDVEHANAVLQKSGLHLEVDWPALESSMSPQQFLNALHHLSTGAVISEITELLSEAALDPNILSSLIRVVDTVAICPFAPGLPFEAAAIGNKVRLPIKPLETGAEVASLESWLEGLVHVKEFREIRIASQTLLKALVRHVHRFFGKASTISVEVLWETFGGSEGIKAISAKSCIDLFDDAFERLMADADGSAASAVRRVIFLHTSSPEEVRDQGVWGFGGLACIFAM